MYRECVARQRRVLGESHPAVLSTSNNLAALLFTEHKLDEAVAMFRTVHEARANTCTYMHTYSL